MTARSLYRRLPLIPILLCLAFPASSVAQQVATPVATPSASVEVVANGLTNPRGFTWGDDGTLYLALAGTGGDLQAEIEGTPYPFFGGTTSSIVTVSNGCTTPLLEGLPSGFWSDPGWTWGVMDVVILNGELYALSAGGGPSWGLPETPNGVYRILADGTWELVADLGMFTSENPTEFIPPDDDPYGSWFDMEAGTDRLWVTEAVRGQVLTVTPDGEIERIVDLSEGHMVPSGLVMDDEGAAYVAFETVPPYPDGGSKVVRVDPDGSVTDYWTGLTAVTDLVIGPDGALYAAEMATNNTEEAPYLTPGTGRVVRQTGPDTLEEVVTGIDYPVFLGFDPDRMLNLTAPAFGTGTAEGEGMLLRININAGPVSLAGMDLSTPTCSGM
jgi:hypothetical protein